MIPFKVYLKESYKISRTNPTVFKLGCYIRNYIIIGFATRGWGRVDVVLHCTIAHQNHLYSKADVSKGNPKLLPKLLVPPMSGIPSNHLDNKKCRVLHHSQQPCKKECSISRHAQPDH